MKRKEPDIPRLCAAIQASRLSLRQPRQWRTEAVRQYCGENWSENGAREKVPVNMISLYVQIMLRNLVAKNPRALLSTFDASMKPKMKAMQDWANDEFVMMDLAGTLKLIAIDGLFSTGYAKIAISSPLDSARASWKLDAGQPFIERVDEDDIVYDIHARDADNFQFIGHRFRAPLDVAREMRHFSKERKNLQAQEDTLYNQQGDERINVLGRGVYGESEDFEPMTDLWEIYLPHHKLVVTLADDQLTGAAGFMNGSGKIEPLNVQRWIGPDTGPYRILSFMPVPGNARGKGPIQDLYELHLQINNIYRKLHRQSHDLKKVVLIDRGRTEDGTRIQNSNDGDIIPVDSPEKAQQVVFGGPDANLTQFGVHLKDLYSFLAGNLELLGGRGPQSKTATQDTMLNQNAGAGVSDMQTTMVNFVADVCRDFLWFAWHHPQKIMTSKYSLPGLPEMPFTRRLYPAGSGHPMSRTGDFDVGHVKVDPYSMQHQTPQQRLQGLMSIVTQVVMPMQQLLQQQGITLDLNSLLGIIGEYQDMPELADILTYQEQPLTEQGGGDPGQGGMAPSTSREYIRRSLGGDTAQNREATMMNNLSSNGQQNKGPSPVLQPMGA